MTNNLSTYIIAEIGQNHNGEMTLAKQLIDVAAMLIFDKFSNRKLKKINAVKFTKRDLSEELSANEYHRVYDSPHSFGTTYGQHRQALEFSIEQHYELEQYARSKDLEFIETLTSIKTLKLLDRVHVDAIKVASRDLTNLPLLNEIGQANLKVIISTGMSDEAEIDDAINVIAKYHENISILHCVSQYPASYELINLMSIPYLKEKYPYRIGFSDHSIGIVMAPAAVTLGATIIEKHITINRNLKGSDHKGSLEPDGLWRMVRDIRNVEIALGKKEKIVPPGVKSAKLKLERSLGMNRDIQGGEELQESDLCLLSPGNGLRWNERDKIVGKKMRHSLSKHSLIMLTDLLNG